MESGRGSEKNNDNQGKRKMETNTTFSEITNQTIEKIKRSRTGSSSIKAPLCTAHDMTSPGYEWLLPGWVAEERHMQSGRVYRVSITFFWFHNMLI